MARNKGIIKLEGTIDNMTFYSSVFGTVVRKAGGPNKTQMLESKNFVRTRENQSEFKACTQVGKLIRQPISQFTHRLDHTAVGRLTKVLMDIKNLDIMADRGQRNVSAGLLLPEGKALLKGFDFNAKASLNRVLKHTLAVKNGDLQITGLVPAVDLVYPAGATHVVLTGIFSDLNLVENTHTATLVEQRLALDATVQNICLQGPTTIPTGMKVYFLQVRFEQKTNDDYYSLDDTSKQALRLVEVV